MIDIQNASIGFDTPQGFKTVVHSVSLQVAAGEAYGLVGESGSGKSTILRALCGMTPLSGGQMQVAGQPVAKHMPKAQRRAVQMVFRRTPRKHLCKQRVFNQQLTGACLLACRKSSCLGALLCRQEEPAIPRMDGACSR